MSRIRTAASQVDNNVIVLDSDDEDNLVGGRLLSFGYLAIPSQPLAYSTGQHIRSANYTKASKSRSARLHVIPQQQGLKVCYYL